MATYRLKRKLKSFAVGALGLAAIGGGIYGAVKLPKAIVNKAGQQSDGTSLTA